MQSGGGGGGVFASGKEQDQSQTSVLPTVLQKIHFDGLRLARDSVICRPVSFDLQIIGCLQSIKCPYSSAGRATDL